MNDAQTLQLLCVFSLGETLFSLDALLVQEIIRLGAITPVRHAPPHVLGIINLRGRLVTIVDPARRIGLDPLTPGEASRILVVDWREESVGILVSRVQDVVPMEGEAVEAAPSNVHGLLGNYLSGVTRFQEHMVPILNPATLLSSEEQC